MKLKENPNKAQVDVIVSFIENNYSGRKSNNTDMKELRAIQMYFSFIEYSKDRLSGLLMLSPLIKDEQAARIATYNEPMPKGSKSNTRVKVMNIRNRLAILDEYLDKLKEAA